MRILVTGATGLLGNNVVRKLLEEGYAVRTLVREQSDDRPLAELDVETVLGDIRDPEAVAKAVAGSDVVVHSAGFVQLGWSQRDLHQQINVDGARNVAQAAFECQARLVHVSTISTLGVGWPDRPADEESANPGIYRCPYVDSKKAGELAVKSFVERGLKATIVHPGFLIGPWDWKPSSGKMLIDVARRWTPVVPSGGFSLTDARDVAAGIHSAIIHEVAGRHYIMAGHNMSYADGWKLFARISGGKAAIWRMRKLAHFLAGRGGDLWARVSGKEEVINSASMGLGRQWHTFSSARAEHELDYQIRPVEETVKDTWAWFQQHGYV